MLYRNLEQDRAFAFISELEFNVLCLQEVPKAFLSRLSTLPYNVVSSLDVELTRGERSFTLHNVILTPHPIRASKTFEIPVLTLSLRSKLCLLLKEGWTNLTRRQGIFADIGFPSGDVRVFSVHLAVLSPSARAKDFQVVASQLRKNEDAVLAGDFNIIEHPLTKAFGWFFGAPLSEVLPWKDERHEVERLFQGWELQNPLRGKITHTASLSQLDHICVPRRATILRAAVLKDTYGSDHKPVFVEFAL